MSQPSQCHSHMSQLFKWFRELQHFGFIVMMSPGHLGLNGKGKAPHWRLTECAYMTDSPTRDFTKWNGELFKDRIRHRNPVAESRTVRDFTVTCHSRHSVTATCHSYSSGFESC